MFVRGNQAHFINKEFSKAIMLRSKLKNIFLKERTEESRQKNYKPRNLCVTLLQKSKRDYLNNLNVKKARDSKIFWKVVKPFTNVNPNEKIALVNDNKKTKSIKKLQRF